ncbi:MAG TPA: DNA polymerase III subunit delta [bacterium]|nr:DNA polymerase III subunit delta [bacterium]HPL95870.1 DNA polymerase III subunit delta [bacterium]
MLYFIFGPEEYLAQQKIKELQNKVGKVAEEKIDGTKVEWGELQNKLTAVSLFNKERFLVITNLTKNKEQKEWAEFLKEKKEISDTVIFYEAEPDKKTSLYKFLASLKNKINCEKLEGGELKKWLKEYVKNKGGQIEERALEAILEENNNDLFYLTNQFDKLLAFNKNITSKNVRLLMIGGFDENIFSLTDALGRKDYGQALELITAQLQSGAEPLYLLAMIARQWRNLILVKEAEEKYQGNYQTMARELSMHPYVVQKTMAQTKLYSFKELESGYQKILETDVALKSSGISSEILLTKLVGVINNK